MGVFRAKHLNAYLNEYVFRWNRRLSYKTAFDRLVGLGIAMAPVTRADIMAQAAGSLRRDYLIGNTIGIPNTNQGRSRMPIPRTLTALIAFSFSTARPAWADTIPPCPVVQGVEERAFGDAVLPVLRDALVKKIGPFALPGEKFDSTDVVMTGQNRRLIFIRIHGDRWVIATEHGGRGYNDPIFAYDVSPDGLSAKIVAEQIAFPATVCSTTEKLLGVQ